MFDYDKSCLEISHTDVTAKKLLICSWRSDEPKHCLSTKVEIERDVDVGTNIYILCLYAKYVP